MRNRFPESHRRPVGFTLIELLVVIGIIAVLLGILIPTISAVKLSGYATATQARVRAISEACERYYQVFQSYPGPQADGQMLPGTAGTGTHYTSSENLVLGLMGGMKPAKNAAPTYDQTKVGLGPQNLNGNQAAWKQYDSFIDAKVGGLDSQGTPLGGWPTWSSAARIGEVANRSNYADTVVPEFTDAFPDAMPILYMRAVRGAKGVGTLLIGQTGDNPVSKPGYQYYPAQLSMYTFNPGATQSKADFPKGFNDYFKLPEDTASPPTTVRSKDAFILITAGTDRIYMTADDVCSFGKPK